MGKKRKREEYAEKNPTYHDSSIVSPRDLLPQSNRKLGGTVIGLWNQLDNTQIGKMKPPAGGSQLSKRTASTCWMTSPSSGPEQRYLGDRRTQLLRLAAMQTAVSSAKRDHRNRRENRLQIVFRVPCADNSR